MFYLIDRDQTNIKNYVLVYWSGQINGNFVYTEYAGVICLCKLESKYIVDVKRNVTIWLVMKWSHDYKSDVSHHNETQIQIARDSTTTSDVNNQWRSNFQQQII
jgi:hypothetical protein